MARKKALPAPPVPPDADLRHFPDFPMGVSQVLDSELMSLADGDEFKAAFRLWLKSWHQVPAGSIPASDKWQADAAGYPVNGETWKRIKKRALHKWRLHSDGRLYHPRVIDKVLVALERSNKSRAKAKKRWKNTPDDETPEPENPDLFDFNSPLIKINDDLSPVNLSLIPKELSAKNPQAIEKQQSGSMLQHCRSNATAMLGEDRIGKDKDSIDQKPSLTLEPSRNVTPASTFEKWWLIYPRRVAKGRALKVYLALLKTKRIAHDQLLKATQRYAESVCGKDEKFIPHPATWLNDQRYLEFLADPKPGQSANRDQAESETLVRSFFCQPIWASDKETITGWVRKPRARWKWLGVGEPGKANCSAPRALFDKIADEYAIPSTEWERESGK